MKIGGVSERSGLSQPMIRHYERIGLIPAAARKSSGYRDYGLGVHTLHFIRNARDLGFEIDDIRKFLALGQDPSLSADDVKAMALAKVEELADKAQRLEEMRLSFYRLARDCSGDVRSGFPVSRQTFSLGSSDLDTASPASLSPRPVHPRKPAERGRKNAKS